MSNNSNNHNPNDFEELYRNIKSSKFHDGIRVINKSLDLSRNKTPTFPLKPNYFIKSDNNSINNNNNSLNNNISNNHSFNFIQNNKSIDFSKNEMIRLKNLFNNKTENYYNDSMIENSNNSNFQNRHSIILNNKFQIKKNIFEDIIKKYNIQANQDPNYSSELINIPNNLKNMNSIGRNAKMDNSILNNQNEKSLDNYLKNPISNDSVLNINLFANDSSDSNQKINLTNINSISDFERLGIIKNNDLNSNLINNENKFDPNISSSKYLETEESNYNNPIIYTKNNVINKINNNFKLNNFNELNLNLNKENLSRFAKKNIGIVIDKDAKSPNNYKNDLINQKIYDKNFILNNNTEIDYENINDNYRNEYNKDNYIKLSKLKNFYSRNNLGKLNNITNIPIINKKINNSKIISDTDNDIILNTTNNPMNRLENTSSYAKSRISPLLVPISNKNSNNKSIYYNYNLNNSIHTPTKLFQIPKIKSEEKDENNIINNNREKSNTKITLNSSQINNNLTNSLNKNNNFILKNDTNLNFNNSIRNINTGDSHNLKNLNSTTPVKVSRDFGDYKKILNPKIRIVSRNVDEKIYHNTENDISKFNINNNTNNDNFYNNNSFVNYTPNNDSDFNKEKSSQESDMKNKKGKIIKNEKDEYESYIENQNCICKIKDNQKNNYNDINSKNNIPINNENNKLNNEKNKELNKYENRFMDKRNIDNNPKEKNFNYNQNGSLNENNKISLKRNSENIDSTENLKELYDKRNSLNKSKENNNNENNITCCSCNKKISNRNINKNESLHNITKNESEKDIANNFSEPNTKKNSNNDVMSIVSKEVLLDENDQNLAYLNKSSKGSSQKDIVISDSNEVEEIEISGKFISRDNSNASLKKKNSTYNSLKEKNDDANILKINSNYASNAINNNKNKGSNYSLKNNFTNKDNNGIDSIVTILDISGYRNSNVNSNQKIGIESEKDLSNKNENKDISKEEKIKIENLIKNLEDKKINEDLDHKNSDNKISSELNEKIKINNLEDNENRNKKTNYEKAKSIGTNLKENYGIFNQITEKVIFIQKFVRDFLRRIKENSNFEKLVSFWDKDEKNLINILIKRSKYDQNIMSVKDIILKMKAYSLENKNFIEKLLKNESFLYKLKRHNKINLKSLKEFFLSLKENLVIQNENIIYVDNQKNKNSNSDQNKVLKSKSKYSEENLERITNALKLSKENDMKISLKNNNVNYPKEELKIEKEETINSDFSTIRKFNEKNPIIKKDNLGKIENKSLQSNELITIEDHYSKNLRKSNSSFGKNTENNSIYFKEDLKNKFSYSKNNKQNNQNNSSIECLSSSSSVSINQKNSEKFIDNNYLNMKSSLTLLKTNTIDNLETFEIQVSNRYKEVNISNDKITNNSVHGDSKFLLDDISTKTLNTCSISDDDFEEENGDLDLI